MKGHSKLFLSCLLAMLALAACQEKQLLPKSGGRPYEVLVVGDEDSVLYSVLSADMVGLPHAEPCFDVSEIMPSQFKDNYELARNIVMLKIDSVRCRTSEVLVQENVYARPQVIISVVAPDAEQLGRFLVKKGSLLRNYLIKAELSRAEQELERKSNVKAEETVRKMFGVGMRVPTDMIASKVGNDFLWLSNNANSGMANICLYTVGIGDFRQQRDSVMRINILGEHDNMYMLTSSIASTVGNKGKSTTIRGLWEMRNDAMGGPFIAYVKPLAQRKNRRLVAEAFVYAPESKKRDILRRLEASLYTLNYTK